MEIRKASLAFATARARQVNTILFDRVMQISGVPTECWPWPLATDRDGYGTLKVGGKSIKAHRAVASLFYPHRPQAVVRHLCNNPSCVNPIHLRPGTALENAADRVANGRSGNLSGERNGRAKLSEAQVIEVRSSSKNGAALARQFGVSKVLICSIRRGTAWSHVPTKGD